LSAADQDFTARNNRNVPAEADLTRDEVYRLESVAHYYGTRRVLHIDQLDVQRGEVLALIGPNGAGKSTLLRLLALLEAPTRGRVTLHLDGRAANYDSATLEERRKVVMVFQRPALLSRSVWANVAYGLRLRGTANIKERVQAVLEAVSMRHLASAKPRTLSGGEIQRVALARAIVLEPSILVLDEPTANLDPYSVRVIENIVLQRPPDTTVIVTTHNIFEAKRIATRVGLMLNGELVEVGSTAQFFNAPRDPRTAAFVNGELFFDEGGTDFATSTAALITSN
jgi:tungstate transport system ATP-binding protein